MGFLSEKDIKEIDLTPEFIVKSDLDIQTIKSISDYAISNGNSLIVVGGYATEAYLGGVITRAHSDVDCIFTIKNEETRVQVFEQIKNILTAEKTVWNFTKPNSFKLDCREDRLDIPFNKRRRVELNIKPNWPEIKTIAKFLQDSRRNPVSILVPELYPLIKGKMEKLYLVRNGIDSDKDRETSISDVIDLARLLQLKEVDKTTLIKYVPEVTFKYVTKFLDEITPQILEYLKNKFSKA